MLYAKVIMKRIGVLTSGGDCPGLNACIRAVVRTASYYNIEVIGFMRGFKGLIDNDYKVLDYKSVAGILQRGGTILLTAREPRFKEYSYRKKAFENIKNLGIDALFVIGGNGSFQGAYLLHKDFDLNVIGIPKTIDNDIYGTEYAIGFDTAVNNAMEAIDKIKDTTMSHERVFIVEVMGRDSGFIALEVGMATGAEITLIPEYPLPIHVIEEKILKAKEMGKGFAIIVLAEGVASAKELAEILNQRLKDKSIGEIRYQVLGYIQRGGSPSAYDRIMASKFGVFAVEKYMEGNKNFMVAYEDGQLKIKPLEISFGKIRIPNIQEYEINNILSL
ncbi:6-phosphofructokinase (Phosphofructokinase)(Phosphohexokinase) [Sulfurihydrogenibium azorense Az-Fu1]|uniref:ATP-dependent 6-phosphofructokinase n=2 Tax=Sulfurihydrogenibium azorense TaxID=309806 RepID=C1DUT0_SULAA|nr:6-phosphofructokinase (Phosphofructokinase)(Phosphohexokinase) [Sulfurihydrogenibium azorense Az-Fu1]